MIWAGSPYAHRIEFSTGFPTGAVSYQLTGNDGSIILDQSITPDSGAISCMILISGVHNSCLKPLFENRALSWSHMTDAGLVVGRVSYQVQKPLPFAASAEGVRLKLGVEEHELGDDEISLVSAYAALLNLTPSGALVIHETAGDQNTILIIHAIEALAALELLPSLQLKVAQRESSGTNEFQRFARIDWDRLEADLLAHVARARQLVDTEFDGAGEGVFTFGKATPAPDVVTGA